MWKGETADWEGQRVGMWQACTSKVIALASRTREGDQRGDGGGEWEPIKILRDNLAYVSSQNRRTSLLSRSRSHSYR
jgi:hypothetical protein